MQQKISDYEKTTLLCETPGKKSHQDLSFSPLLTIYRKDCCGAMFSLWGFIKALHPRP